MELINSTSSKETRESKPARPHPIFFCFHPSVVRHCEERSFILFLGEFADIFTFFWEMGSPSHASAQWCLCDGL